MTFMPQKKVLEFIHSKNKQMEWPNEMIDFEVYDLRADFDKEKATCYEAGIETLKEAVKSAKSFGGGVIFKSWSKKVGERSYETYKSEKIMTIQKIKP